jgi:hypothetical protein
MKELFKNPTVVICVLCLVIMCGCFALSPETFGKFTEYLWCQTFECVRVYPTP